jgi:protein O-GlcNAc transferase
VAGRHPASDQPLWRGERYRHSKIRVGYVSGDFRDHAVSMLAAGLFEKHDRERFEVIGISLAAAQNTPLAARVTASFTRFLDVTQRSDAQAAAQIRGQEVDILVDLMGFTRGCRPDIFARRPAPVQVNYLGYPGTMGAPYMDYILADDFVIPRDSRVHYGERVVYLPHCFQVNDDSRFMDAVPSREAAGLPPSGLVFCSFNSSHKLNPVFFGIWMRLLMAIPGSVLWLLGETPPVKANLRRESAVRGIDPERLIFADRLPYAAHLARLALADLFLDSIPFSGGATVSDALWVGVPVVTCAGRALASRMAGSLMRAVGLIEGITDSVDAYEAAVLRLAASPLQLTEWRERLAQGRRDSPLFDTDLFRRHLECAYSAMWDRHQRGEEPESFDVLPLEAPRP